MLTYGCVTTTGTVGIPSKFHDISHEGTKNNTYAVAEVASRSDEGWDLNVGSVLYRVNGDHFQNVSVGLKKWFTKKWKWFYVEAGLGGKYTEIDERNPWLDNSHILADICGGVGVKAGAWSIGYTFQHLSAPWRDDYGLNFDVLTIKYEF